MQTAMTQRAFVAAQPVRAASQNTRAARSAVVVRASAEESRRAVLGGLLAGIVGLTAGKATAANIDLIDDRKSIEKGFNIVYEARELDLPQGIRDGLSQARADLAGTRKRISESEKRIDAELEPFIKKNYWTEGREQLRRQVGTLRFDINAVADTLPKATKKEALALKKQFFSEIDALDYAMRKGDEAAALAALEKAKASLDATLAKLS